KRNVKVFLIRHAQSVENALGLGHHVNQTEFNAFIGKTLDAPLSMTGLLQTRRIIRQLRDESIQRLYTSPFARARCTADALGRGLKVTPQVMRELGEIVPARLPESEHETSLRRHYLRGYMLLGFPTSKPENWLAVYRRARRVWRVVMQENANPVAIV